MKVLNNIDLVKNQILNAKLQNVAVDPTPLVASDEGLVWINTGDNLAKVYDGTSIQRITNILEGVTGSGAITVGAVSSKSQAVSIAAASAVAIGTMSIADFNKLAGATSANTASTIVSRDVSGNFSAGVITASLTGTASNSSTLEGANLVSVRSFNLSTGTRPSTAISDFSAAVTAHTLNSMAVPVADVAFNNRKITGLADPASPGDAATKNYVDGVASGLDIKASVRAASVANVVVTYSNAGGVSSRGQMTACPNVLDTVSLANGNRVLLKNQTLAAQNGIWVVTTVGAGATGIWDRASDFDVDTEVTDGAFMFVEEGTQASSGWVLTTPNPIIIGGVSGTSLAFAQFSGAGSYTASNGILLTASNFTAVTANSARIAVGASGIDISATYVGQNTITTLGTIAGASAVWGATATNIAVASGGTGGSTVAAAKTNLGFITKFAVNVGDGANGGTAASATPIITHTCNSLDVTVALFEIASGVQVYADVTRTSVSSLTLGFSTGPTANSLRCVVTG